MFPLQALPGLENPALKLFLGAVAVAIFLWGFERYRTNFSKLEFLVAILLSLGILSVGFATQVFGALAALFNLESRFILVSILANTAFVFLILYVIAMVRSNQLSIAELTRSLTVDQAGGEPVDGPSVYVVIPAYNESATVREVVAELPEEIRGHAVRPLVVSDGSSDDTAGRVEDTRAIVVEHPLNQGQGGALKTGFRIALRHGADVVVTMDADGQHPVDQLGALVGPIIDDEADYVVGSRYIGVDESGNSYTRQAGIRAFTALINVLTKAGVTDVTNGYRAIRGSRLAELTLTEERFSAPELLIEARKNGLRIEEVPVTIERREAGESKKPGLGYALGLARTIVVTWFR